MFHGLLGPGSNLERFLHQLLVSLVSSRLWPDVAHSGCLGPPRPFNRLTSQSVDLFGPICHNYSWIICVTNTMMT